MKLKKVSYVYSEGDAFEKKALDEISLEIPDGQFIGIIGHTGSGKSTLIQHLNGLLRATSGAIYYDGENIYQEGYDMRTLRSKVGLVFQYPEHQLFEVDVFSDVCFGPKNLGLSKEEVEERAKKALTQVGLDESYYKKSPFELSGGQKRRVAIAGILAMHPQVLILDEPTAGLDPKGRDEILDQVALLQKERKITVILVSHSMEDVARYVERIIVVNDGKILFDDTPKQVFQHYKELESVGLAAPQVTYVVKALNEIDGISCNNPHGAFYIFVNIKSLGMTSMEVAEYLLDNAKIALVPGSAFGSEGEGYLRISYACSYEDLQEACARIKKAVEELKNK